MKNVPDTPRGDTLGEGSLGDTIVARATAPGRGALAVIRLSGPGARGILSRLSGGETLPEPRRAVLRTLRDPRNGQALDRALVTSFPGPDSYTGEDVVEISTHGGLLVPALVMEACETLGARMAEPGEFTRRAYLNGKLDLVQVEAVQDLIEGRSRAAHGAALHQLEGGLSRRIAGIREGLLRLEVLLAHHLDFPDEDEPPTPLGEVGKGAEALRAEVEGVLRLAPEGVLLREGALVVLAGPPNAGKSSLFNLLLGEERAIVTPEPGTTRDALEGTVSMGGFPFRLVDTAGLREAPGTVERMGVEVARRYLAAAHVVLYCHPADQGWGGEEEIFLRGLGDRPTLILRTCADRLGNGAAGGRRGAGPEAAGGGQGAGSRGRGRTPPGWDGGKPTGWKGGAPPAVEVSVRTGQGVAEVREALRKLVFSGLVEAGEDVPVVTRERQRRRLTAAERELAAFCGAVGSGVPADVAGVHLREAGAELEELVGVIDPEEMLDHLFSSFCIGK
jgi:tRNA modification GTPase